MKISHKNIGYGITAAAALSGIILAAEYNHAGERGVTIATEQTSHDLDSIEPCSDVNSEIVSTRSEILNMVIKFAPEGKYKEKVMSTVDIVGSAVDLPDAVNGVSSIIEVAKYFEENKSTIHALLEDPTSKPFETLESLNIAILQLEKAIKGVERIKQTGLCFNDDILGKYIRILTRSLNKFDTNKDFQRITNPLLEETMAVKLTRMPFDYFENLYKLRKALKEFEGNLRLLTYLTQSLINKDLEEPSNNAALNSLLGTDINEEHILEQIRDAMKLNFKQTNSSSNTDSGKKSWSDRLKSGANKVKGWFGR